MTDDRNEREMEAIAEALDDLVMSKGVALDEARLDWLTEWVAERVAQARHEGASEALDEAAAHPTLRAFPRTATWLRRRAAAHREATP